MSRVFSGSLVSVGVDWLTVTASDQTFVDLLRAKAFALAEVEMSLGMFGRPWRFAGYEGFHCGGLEYGERADGCCIMVHDVVAAAHWLPIFRLGQNCSRIDLQCTLRMDQDPHRQLMVHLRDMRARDKKLKGKPQCSHRVCPRRGMTIESGARQSDRFLRIYNKDIQSGREMFSRCMRYEAELKGRQALHTAMWLSRMSERHVAIANYVCGFTSARGGRPTALSKALQGAETIVSPRLAVRMTDVEKSRRWLGNVVKPSIARLIDREGVDSVKKLLGIP
jgi:Replication initiation factor